ncbi:MAG: alcohol dehydrogenase catalytic domain-containing protein [bacterium]|nr:alcohol dehydrogenase catalytic domain-containing protein [bacterium]
MKAVYIDKSGGINLRKMRNPNPARGEALIKVRMAGICRTDQELAKGYMDFQGIPGHEFVGEVVAVDSSNGADAKEWIGSRVVGEINCGCGRCAWCQSGLARHCPHRTVLGISGRDGALAEYLTLPISNLRLVPDELDDQSAVFTEPVAAALEIFEQVLIKPTHRVLVVGDGKLGILVARVLQIHGSELVVVGHSSCKLAILRNWGIEAIEPKDLTQSQFDVVVEASGSPAGFSLAMSVIKPRGTLILKSTYAGTLSLDMAPLVINEIFLVGSRCGLFDPALACLKQGLVRVQDIISAVFPFDKCLAAFEYATQPNKLKVLIDFNQKGWIIEHNPEN